MSERREGAVGDVAAAVADSGSARRICSLATSATPSRCREVLEDWIERNPYAHGVNWTCTMEVAMRDLHVDVVLPRLLPQPSLGGSAFQSRFLRTLFLHGEFTERYLERSDINGNHFTADAAGARVRRAVLRQGRRSRAVGGAGLASLCATSCRGRCRPTASTSKPRCLTTGSCSSCSFWPPGTEKRAA